MTKTPRQNKQPPPRSKRAKISPKDSLKDGQAIDQRKEMFVAALRVKRSGSSR